MRVFKRPSEIRGRLRPISAFESRLTCVASLSPLGLEALAVRSLFSLAHFVRSLAPLFFAPHLVRGIEYSGSIRVVWRFSPSFFWQGCDLHVYPKKLLRSLPCATSLSHMLRRSSTHDPLLGSGSGYSWEACAPSGSSAAFNTLGSKCPVCHTM